MQVEVCWLCPCIFRRWSHTICRLPRYKHRHVLPSRGGWEEKEEVKVWVSTVVWGNWGNWLRVQSWDLWLANSENPDFPFRNHSVSDVDDTDTFLSDKLKSFDNLAFVFMVRIFHTFPFLLSQNLTQYNISYTPDFSLHQSTKLHIHKFQVLPYLTNQLSSHIRQINRLADVEL